MPKVSTKLMRRVASKVNSSILTDAINEGADYIDKLEVENELIKDRNMNLHNSNVELIYENKDLKSKINLEYVESLENYLISACQILGGREKTILGLAKDENNKAYSESPKVQGTSKAILYMQIAELSLDYPSMSLTEVYEMLKKRDN